MRLWILAGLATTLLAGCGPDRLEPVTLDKKPTVFSSEGKCQQLIGTQTVDVACPKQ